MTEEQKLDVYKFRINAKDDNVNKCRNSSCNNIFIRLLLLRKLNAIVAKIQYLEEIMWKKYLK